MADTLRLKSLPVTTITERPTVNLRFVMREKRYILQQQFQIVTGRLVRLEWRDVTLVKDLKETSL